MIKKFICGKCGFFGTRKDLRKHLREEHLIKREITNFNSGKKIVKRPEWKTEEFND